MKKFLFICSLMFVIGIGLWSLYGSVVHAQGGSGNKLLRGYGWSDNIGWTSFSCKDTSTCSLSNYQVHVDASGTLSGYGWSDNVGWISFNQSELVGCPSGSCSARISGGKLEGWGRFIAATGRTDGWDGWMYFGPASYSATVSNTPTSDGWAWGHDVVGWMTMIGLYLEDDVTINSIDPITISSIQMECLGNSVQARVKVNSPQATLPIQFGLTKYRKQGASLTFMQKLTVPNSVNGNELTFLVSPILQNEEYVFVADAIYNSLSAYATSSAVTYTGVPDCSGTVVTTTAEIQASFVFRPDIADASGRCKAYWEASSTDTARDGDIRCSFKQGSTELKNTTTESGFSVVPGKYTLTCDLLNEDDEVESTKSITRICQRNPTITEH